MQVPERACRLAEIGGTVAQHGERMVAQAGIALEAALGLGGAGRAQGQEPTHAKISQAGNGRQQDGDMQPHRQDRRQAQQGKAYKRSNQREARPQRQAQALRPEHGAGCP